MRHIDHFKMTALVSAVLFALGAELVAQPPSIIIKDPLDVPREPGDGRKVLTLANGATLEVVGISTHPAGPKTWWDHSGKPMSEAPCDASGNQITPSADGVVREILVRMKGVPDGADAGFGLPRQVERPRSGVAWRPSRFGSDRRHSRVPQERRDDLDLFRAGRRSLENG